MSKLIEIPDNGIIRIPIMRGGDTIGERNIDLSDFPVVDAVPVVRCRECKHCDPENYHCDHPMGTAAPLRREPDDFCSYGERKEGADNDT